MLPFVVSNGGIESYEKILHIFCYLSHAELLG